MYSINKLKSDCNKQLDSTTFDNDVKVNMTISDIKYWCNDFLKIHKNIEKTSISPSHKIERFNKLLKDILD